MPAAVIPTDVSKGSTIQHYNRSTAAHPNAEPRWVSSKVDRKAKRQKKPWTHHDIPSRQVLHDQVQELLVLQETGRKQHSSTA
jgi:hypothetical protein